MDVVRLLDEGLEEAVHLHRTPAGQKREQIDDVAPDRMQPAATHQVVTAPVVLLPEEAPAVNLRLADQELAHVTLLHQLLHVDEGGEEAQHVTHDAEQLWVVLGCRHHVEGVQRRRRSVAYYIFANS